MKGLSNPTQYEEEKKSCKKSSQSVLIFPLAETPRDAPVTGSNRTSVAGTVAAVEG